jgi:hypothetical protein
MKITIFVLAVLMCSTLMSSSLTVIEEKGTTVGRYAKPGAPVDLTFTSQNVDPGEVSEINIVLTTSVNTGKMEVSIKRGKGLDLAKETDRSLDFTLGQSTNEYPLALFVTAEKDGVYYIKLLVSIEGEGSRAFAVPVFIGEGRVKKSKTPQNKSASGENISVSKAVESTE